MQRLLLSLSAREEAACQQRREGDWRWEKKDKSPLLEQKQRLAQEKEELEAQFQELSQRLSVRQRNRGKKAEGEQNSVQEKLTAAEERLAQLLAEAEAGSEL